jgi:hypothetical protein
VAANEVIDTPKPSVCIDPATGLPLAQAPPGHVESPKRRRRPEAAPMPPVAPSAPTPLVT